MRQRTSAALGPAYVAPAAVGAPAVRLRRNVVAGIREEVLTGLNAVPRRGVEVGGVLIGSRTRAGIAIEDFEPVPSEHRFGPSYVLSDTDRALLVETLEYFRSERPQGLDVVGWYRSHTRPAFDLSEEDHELFGRHFGEGDVMLLVQPTRLQNSTAVFFYREEGRVRRRGETEPFPFEAAAEAPAPPPAPPVVTVVPMAEPAVSKPEPPPVLQPLSRPEPPPPAMQGPTPFRPVRYVPAGAPFQRGKVRRTAWVATAAALAVLGGLLGYLSLERPASRATRIDPSPVVRTVLAPNPVPAADVREEVEEFIQRWRSTMSRGDAEAAADMYAPTVTRYFRMRNASRADVVATIRAANRRWGRLVRNEITDLRITPEGSDRAVATFRKTWQTAGPRFFAGEERERLRLVRHAGGWKIASEEELQVYWVRRDR